MTDVGMLAFSLFFMQSESFLDYQRQMELGHSSSNCHMLFGIKQIPTDNHIQALLDRVSPAALEPCFDQVLEQLRERDGAKRWLAAHGERVQTLHPVYLGDDLFCSQPLAEAVLATGADFLFVAKRDSHKTLYEYLKGADLERLVRLERKPGNRSITITYRWIAGVLLRDGPDALKVNWVGVPIANAAGKTTYDGAFATSLPIAPETVAEIAACARARWKTRKREL